MIPHVISTLALFGLALLLGATIYEFVVKAPQFLLLASFVASWQIAAARWRLLMAPGVLVLIEVITFTFHDPRLAIMFKAPMPEDPARLGRAARKWALGNMVRAVLLAVAFLSALQAVTILAMRLAA